MDASAEDTRKLTPKSQWKETKRVLTTLGKEKTYIRMAMLPLRLLVYTVQK